MRYLKIPETIFVKDANGRQLVVKTGENKVEPVTVSMHNFLTNTVLKAAKYCENAVSVMKAIDLAEAVEEAAPNSYIEMSEEDYALLKEACETTSVPFNPEIALQLGPFIKAILKAPTEKPEDLDKVIDVKPVAKKKASTKKANKKTSTHKK